MRMRMLMKLIVLATTLIVLRPDAIAQYTVTKVIGQVKNRTSGEVLKTGSKLKDDDMLEFSSPRDLVRVIVSGKGVYVIGPNPPKNKEQSLIVEMLKSALKIKSREGYLSGRSDDSDLVPGVFETETAVNSRILITQESRFLFDKSRYNAENGNRFFIQIQAEGADPEIHALSTSGDTLIISASDLHARREAKGQLSYKVGYFDRAKNSSSSLATIRPYVDTSGEMSAIIKLILDDYEERDLSKLREICYGEVYQSMGKPSPIDFHREFDRLSSHISKKE